MATDAVPNTILLYGFYGLCGLAGEAFLRCGSTHSATVVAGLTHTMINLCFGAVLWWVCGYALAFGSTGPVVGGGEADLFAMASDDLSQPASDAHLYATWVVLSLALGVVSCGAVGRIGWEAYTFVACCVSLGFAVVVHWVWGGGWLSAHSGDRLGSGLLDNGACALVHVYGGAGAMALMRLVPGDTGLDVVHDKFSVGAGMVILWFAWYARLALASPFLTAPLHSHACVFLTIGTSTAVVGGLFVSGEKILTHVTRCALAGLISTTSAGFYVPLHFSPLIGTIGAALATSGHRMATHYGIYDPLGGVSVHITCGVWGTLATALFADTDLLHTHGLAAGRAELLGTHSLAVVVLMLAGAIFTAVPIFIVQRIYGVAAHVHLDVLKHGGSYCPLICDEDDIHENLDCVGPGVLTPEGPDPSLGDSQALAFSRVGHPEPTSPGSLHCVIHPLQGPASTPGNDAIPAELPPPDVVKPIPEAVNGFRLPRFQTATLVRLAVYACVLGGATAYSAAREHSTASVVQTPNMTEADLTALLMQAKETLAALEEDLNGTWVLLCAVGVFLMQMGFCFLEAGSVRSVNVINIIFKNLMDCSLGAIMWWLTGYSFAFGEGSGFIGADKDLFAMSPSPSDAAYGVLAHFFLSFTYMTASCTIVSGAIAERMDLHAYSLFVVLTSGFSYPVVVHWGWSSTGFLSAFSGTRVWGDGVLDFAGSAVIHLFGGTSALMMASLVGARRLPGGVCVFSEEGQRTVSPHNKFQQATGTLLLWFAWFMFNGGSVVSLTGGGSSVAAHAITATVLSSAFAGLFGVIATRLITGFLDIGHVCNSVLVGLVAITSGCAYVSLVCTPVIALGGVAIYWTVHFLRRRLRIDDVVDAGAVHCGGGLWGTLATGLFCDTALMDVALQRPASGGGLLTQGSGTQLGVQLLFCMCTIAWAVMMVVVVYLLCRVTVGVRVPEDAELSGIDVAEHRSHSYDYIEKIEEERKQAVASVALAQEIASSLVSFDLNEAERVLTQSGEAPPGTTVAHLQKAFWSLLQNLTCYRPYLPDSLFGDEGAEAVVEVDPPGANGRAAIVFTDIQGSTASWEACPNEMRDALRIHNRLIRACVTRHGGYEVKTIGDAFMVAFETAEAACLFALDVQLGLFEVGAEWPAELGELPQCKSKTFGPAWSGLCVRIGVNYGDVNSEANPLTGRTDYSGSTVNKAARLEAQSKPGAVAVSQELADHLHQSGFIAEHNPIVTRLQEVVMKGVPGSHTLHLLMPHGFIVCEARVSICTDSESLAGGQSSVNSHTHGRKMRLMAQLSDPPKFAHCSIGQVFSDLNLHTETPGEIMDSVSLMASRLIATADRTDGTVHALTGNRTTVVWNVRKRCMSHLQSAVRYASYLETMYRPETMSVGLVTGTVLHGKVGTREQRFVNIYGQTFALSEHIVAAARELSLFGLLASMPGETRPSADPFLGPCVRPVLCWEVGPEFSAVTPRNSHRPMPGGQAEIFQLLPGLSEQLGSLEFTAVSSTWGWSPAYSEAFWNRDFDIILEKTKDPVVSSIVAINRGERLLRSMPFWVTSSLRDNIDISATVTQGATLDLNI